MQAEAQQQQQPDGRHEQNTKPPRLDDRYGNIGISAVAAAVRWRGKKRDADRAPLVPHDCD